MVVRLDDDLVDQLVVSKENVLVFWMVVYLDV
jgi:hypothetical protein